MKTQTAAVPEGYKSLSGNLPPFVTLEIGQALHGQIFRYRTTTKTEKVKVKGKGVEEIEKTKHYLDLTLVDAGKFNIGTVKKPEMRDFEAGESVTLNLTSGILNPIMRELFAEIGKPADYWPEEGEDFPEVPWASLYGRKMFVRREKDGLVKKGEFAGNKRNVYTVALSEATKRK